MTVARDSQDVVYGLDGLDRLAVYAAAMGTGFRAGELGQLQPEWFLLDDAPAVVQLPAREDKASKSVRQPIPAEVADLLRTYLAGRPAAQPVWHGSWHERAAEVLRVDLEAAGIPYTVEGPDGPLYADFHALRHSYIALLDKSGATLKEAMQLARHSDPKLTMAVYGRAQLHDLAGAVERLPSVLPPGGAAAPLQATGTGGRITDKETPAPRPCRDQTGDTSGG